jgi:hypothetical protein
MAHAGWHGRLGATALMGALVGIGCGNEYSAAPLPKVGDTNDDGGKVTEVVPESTQCISVTVEMPPAWECTQEEKDLARGVSAPPVPTVIAPPPMSLGFADVSLEQTDCEGLAELRRPVLKRSYQAQLDAGYRNQLASRCFPTFSSYLVDEYGKRIASCPRSYASGGTSAAIPGVAYSPSAPGNPSPTPTAATPSPAGTTAPPPTAGTEDEGGGASEVSTTNTQVHDVDEPDFVKNDNEHVYVLSPTGLHVVDAWPAEEAREIARIQVVGEPRRMFLQGDVLAVYSRVQSSSFAPNGVGAAGQSPSMQGCTYGYDCRFTSEGGRTAITLFDVSNAAAPVEIHRFELSGGFVAARRVGPTVYTVVHDTGATAAPPVDLQLAYSSLDELRASYAARRGEVEAAIDAVPAAYFVPWIGEVGEAGGQPEPVEACDSALVSKAAAGLSFVSLVAFDLETLEPPRRTLIAGKPGFVYSSAEALYLATDGVDGGDAYPQPYYGAAAGERSTIHKFSLDGTSTRYAGSQSVRGHVLNQFSMDEQDGVLRVATSSGRVPNPDVSSNVTTFGPDEQGQFVLRGELTGLAPQEDIRSVRFDGDRGFVVTFKKTDPLFVIDLSEPSAPKVLGELKIPGFSTYMHRLDDNHLLAVGFDADDHGDFAYFDGIQIQIFDVTDLADPKLLHKTVIGTRGSGSEALMNHLAFNYFAQKQLLALPMTVCEGGDDGVYADKLTFSGLLVFDVSLEDGIVERGRMPFVDAQQAAPAGAAGASCGTWWSSSTSLVKRSIFMDDFALGISDAKLNVANLGELSKILASVNFTQ